MRIGFGESVLGAPIPDDYVVVCSRPRPDFVRQHRCDLNPRSPRALQLVRRPAHPTRAGGDILAPAAGTQGQADRPPQAVILRPGARLYTNLFAAFTCDSLRCERFERLTAFR